MATKVLPIFPLTNLKNAAVFYRRVLDRYSSKHRFGMISRATGQPIHRNHRRNPLPIYANGGRRPDANGPKKTLGHLNANKQNRQAVFLVNRPDADTYLLAVDWDCAAEAVDGGRRVEELADRFHAEIGRRSFIEPSRNRRGRYNWIRVRRDESLEQFLVKLNRLNKVLSLRYGRKDDNGGVGFDAIKGSPWHRTPNPLYDPTSWSWVRVAGLNSRNVVSCPDFLDGLEDRYEWHRKHYRRGRFDRIECLEPDTLHFGTLVTQPLCGVLLDGEEGAARWAGFFAWEANDANVVSSTELWSLFDLSESSHLPAASPATLTTPTDSGPSRTEHSARSVRSACAGHLWTMLTDKHNKLDSMNGAAAVTVTRLGLRKCIEQPHAALVNCLRLYERLGAATDAATPDRVRRARESLQYFVSTFDDTKRSRIWFDVDRDVTKDVAGLINGMLSSEQLNKFNSAHWAIDECGKAWRKRSTYVTRRLLHLAYCCVLKVIVRDGGALSVRSLRRFLSHFGHTCNGVTLKTIMMILVHLGLITCVDTKYRFFPRNAENGFQRIAGECRIWAVTHDAPLPQFILPHVPHRISHNGRGRYSSPEAAEVKASTAGYRARVQTRVVPPRPAALSLGNKVCVSDLIAVAEFDSENAGSVSSTEPKPPLSQGIQIEHRQTPGGCCAPAALIAA